MGVEVEGGKPAAHYRRKDPPVGAQILSGSGNEIGDGIGSESGSGNDASEDDAGEEDA